MSELVWDQSGERLYETGVKNGVLYPAVSGAYPLGVAWNGLMSVTESPTGGEATPLYADDIKYLNLISLEEFAASVEAYTYPDEFELCNGVVDLEAGVSVGQQNRTLFGMAYKTTIGNDVDGNEYGYKLHLIYGALAAPSEKAYSTINDTPEAITLSWDITTTPAPVTGKKPTASIIIDSTKVDAAGLAALELVLYGTTGVDPRLPLPNEVATIVSTTPSAVALSTSVPADEAVTIALDADVVLTFNNAIVQSNVLMMTVAGVPVATTKTWDSTAKILTVNPNANLTASTEYIVVVDGVVDQFAQLLATETVSFTTTA
jgi:hypothetical protein